MKRTLTTLLAAAMIVVPAAAAEKRNDGGNKAPDAAASSVGGPLVTVQTRNGAVKRARFGGANVGDARIALVWDFERGVERSKGVSAVRAPKGKTGLYCIKPTGFTSSQIANLAPNVTVDYGGSSGDALAAYFFSRGCRSSEIGVLTLRGDDGLFDRSDAVGFTLVVD